MNWLSDYELRLIVDTGMPQPTKEQVVNLAREVLAYRQYIQSLQALLKLQSD